MNKNNDLKLVESMLAGRQDAFDCFFHDYFPRLFRFAKLRLWNDQSLAEDAVQSALSKAVTKLHTFRGEAALYTWLCTFCRHEISKIVQKEKKLGESVALVEDDPAVRAALESLALSSNQDPDLQFRLTEVKRLVHIAQDHLPQLYKQVLKLKYLEGLSIGDIAKQLQRSEKSVESLLSRARIAFKEAISTLLQDSPNQNSPLEELSR